MTVTREEIQNAVRDGHRDLDALKSTLLCCTGCGTCEGRVTKVLQDTLKAMKDEEAAKVAG